MATRERADNPVEIDQIARPQQLGSRVITQRNLLDQFHPSIEEFEAPSAICTCGYMSIAW